MMLRPPSRSLLSPPRYDGYVTECANEYDLIRGAGGGPAVVAAVGMLAGFCGTLMTPMAANFNLMPAALLDLKDRYGVIRAQLPTAIPLLAFNAALLYAMIA